MKDVAFRKEKLEPRLLRKQLTGEMWSHSCQLIGPFLETCAIDWLVSTRLKLGPRRNVPPDSSS